MLLSWTESVQNKKDPSHCERNGFLPSSWPRIGDPWRAGRVGENIFSVDLPQGFKCASDVNPVAVRFRRSFSRGLSEFKH